MRRILLWYNSSREGTRLFLGSLAAAIVFYFTALLSVWIGATLAVGGRWLLGLHAVVLIFFLTLVVLVSRSLAVLRSEQRRTLEERRDALMLAYTHMDRLESSLLRDVKTSNVTHLDLDRLVTS